MVIRKVQVAQFILPRKRFVKVASTVPVAKSGDDVILKANVPVEFDNYRDKIGKWQGQIGEFSHVHFAGQGTVTIRSSFLIVM